MPQEGLDLRELFLKVIIPKFLSFMVILTQALLTLGIGAQVFFRYILHQDLYGSEEFILIFAFWLYMMGAAYGSFEDSHIQADIVNEYVKSEKLRLRLNLLVSCISTGVCLVINYWAFNYVVWGIVKHARSIAWKIPMVIPQSSIFIGFSVMSIYSLMKLCKLYRKAFPDESRNISDGDRRLSSRQGEVS
ncbi:MAG: TRAP transporter small permease [Synergistales bacterium]|nr:TRAP transporter small permease [Synergistales bacterium]